MNDQSKPKLVVLGTGSHAKVVVETLDLLGEYEIIGCLSGDPDAPKALLDYPLLGDWDLLPKMDEMGVRHVAIGVGGWTDNKFRKEIFERAMSHDLIPVSAVHPSANISGSATIGQGSAVYAGAIIQNEVSIGANAVIATGAQIDHESTVEDHALVSAGATVGGKVTVGEGSLLAIASTVVSNVTIGKNALVAAGAVVVGDVPDEAQMFGVPARPRQ